MPVKYFEHQMTLFSIAKKKSTAVKVLGYFSLNFYMPYFFVEGF